MQRANDRPTDRQSEDRSRVSGLESHPEILRESYSSFLSFVSASLRSVPSAGWSGGNLQAFFSFSFLIVPG